MGSGGWGSLTKVWDPRKAATGGLCWWGYKYISPLSSFHPVNKQLADKERVAAALENTHLLEVVNQCLSARS